MEDDAEVSVKSKQGRSMMVERLGNVLYWTGCAAAVGVVILSSVNDVRRGTVDSFTITVAVVGAVGCWALGRALRYILAGR